MSKEISGPVIPLPIPFKSNHELDLDGLCMYVDFLCNHGIKNIMTTVGTSRFNLVSADEIKEINANVVKAVDGRAVTILSSSMFGDIRIAKELAQHSYTVGGDYYLLYFPERHYGEENTFDYFHQVASSTKINVLIHEMPMRNGLGSGTIQFSIELLNKLLNVPNIKGLKEEALDVEYSNRIVNEFSKDAIIIGAGGGMSRYFNRDFDLGAKAYLGGIGNFIPELELEFYDAITSGNRAKAEKIVKEIELPYFEKVVPMGWHPSLKAVLGIKGLMSFVERPPMKEIKGKELHVLQEILRVNNWL